MQEDIDDIRTNFKQSGYAVIKYDDSPVHSYPYDSPWVTDEKFNKLYDKIKKNTLVDRPRCYALYLLADSVKNIKGNILEVGVWRGGTAGIFTQIFPKKKVYLCDTFTGVVKSSRWEHYTNGAHSDTSEQIVTEFLNGLGVKNYKILKGIFPERTGSFIENEKFALVYLDLDVYKSTRDAFNFIWGKVTPGGIVVFDDYGMISACEGISRFVNEIRQDKDKIFIPNLNGQAYIIKK